MPGAGSPNIFAAKRRLAACGKLRLCFAFRHGGSVIQSIVVAMNEPWWRTQSRLLWWTATRILAPFMALGWPALIAYGLLHPHASDLDALQLAQGEAALLIGTSAIQRSYIVLPRALQNASVSVVNHLSGTRSVMVYPGQALAVLLLWGLFAYCTWHFWIRPVLKASSNRFE
jgi:hypothetical protein